MSKKSKESISVSLMTLLKNNSFEEITISEICDNSDIVRRTFYNNFCSKIDVINYMIMVHIEEYLKLVRLQDTHTPQKLSYLYFSYWYKKRVFLDILHKNKLLYLMQDNYIKYLPMVVHLIPSETISLIKEEDLEYIYSFYAAGLITLLVKWVESNYLNSSEDMSKTFSLIAKGI